MLVATGPAHSHLTRSAPLTHAVRCSVAARLSASAGSLAVLVVALLGLQRDHGAATATE